MLYEQEQINTHKKSDFIFKIQHNGKIFAADMKSKSDISIKQL